MDVSGAHPAATLRRSQLLYVAMSLVPLGVMTYLAVTYMFPTFREQNQDELIFSIMGAIVLTAVLSLLGYTASKRDTVEAIDQVERSRKRLSDLLTASQSIAQHEFKDKVASDLAHHVNRAVRARATLVWLPEDNGLRLAGAEGAKNGVVPLVLEPGQGLAGRALAAGKPEKNAPLKREDRSVDEAVGIRTLHALAVPMLERGAARGVITVHDRRDSGPFETADLELVAALAQHGAMAVQNATAHEEQRNYSSHVTRILATIIERNLLWSGHLYNVDRYSSLVARALGLEEDMRRKLYFASTLHDIGVVHPMRSAAGRTVEALHDHPGRAAEMLSPILVWRECAPLIECHHEHMDGSGYPRGLHGDEIPIGARILAVADWFDEMTNPNSPLKAYSVEQAMELLEHDGGRRFDPAVARAFRDVVAQHGS